MRTEVVLKPQNWMKIVQRVEQEEGKKMVLKGATFQGQQRGQMHREPRGGFWDIRDGRPYSTSPLAHHLQGLACDGSQCVDAVGLITVMEHYFVAH